MRFTNYINRKWFYLFHLFDKITSFQHNITCICPKERLIKLITN